MNKYISVSFFWGFSLLFISSYSYFLSLTFIILSFPLVHHLRIDFLACIYFVFTLSYIQSAFIPQSDSISYLYYFEHLSYENNIGGLKDLNVGYYSLNFLGRLFFDKENFFFINSMFLYSMLLFLIHRLDKQLILLLFILVCFLGFINNINFLIRQYYSSIILLIAFSCGTDFKRSCLVRGILYIVALSFHLSAVLFMPVTLRKVREKILNNWFKLIIISIAISLVFNISFLHYLYTFSDVFPLFEKLRYYQSIVNITPVAPHRLAINILLFLFLMGVNIKHLSERDKIFQALLIYSMILYISTSGVSVLASRLGFFIEFFLGVFVYIPLKYRDKYSFFTIKFNPLVMIWLYVFLQAIYWGSMNEKSHTIKYFNGELLSSGWFLL
ncbi:EpsG family protein [Pseudoalteromonas sp. MMG010]|uniref:EpsG family protein n=1 Tax=Pseudoalteromonas sp. MMG010 TaxID=2822685 RepID=UPI001B39DB68|nr:EpsG family protein [Pseudoalteromonas sp. MMG010]MBQ4834228.1 EpsG family protein [Pseudoalteromonas sp. MMG010]